MESLFSKLDRVISKHFLLRVQTSPEQHLCLLQCVPGNEARSIIDQPIPQFALAFGALKRRTHWPLLTAASAAFDKSPILGRWHPEVKALWNEHGFVPVQSDAVSPFESNTSTSSSRRDRASEAVQLATPSWAEAVIFAETSSRGAGWDQLGQLTLPVDSIIGSESIALGSPELSAELVLRPPGSRAEAIDGAGHLVVQEKPDEVADCLARFLGSDIVGNLPTIKGRDRNVKARL